MINKRIRIIFVAFMLIFLLAGCGNSEFEEDYNTYKELYVSVVNEFTPKDSNFDLEKLKEKHILEKIDQMKIIVTKMSSNASNKREKQMLSNVIKFNEGLEFFQYAAKNKEDLTEDERGKITSELLSAERYRRNIEDKKY